MYLFHFFRSFLPFRNPIGFGASDFVEILLAVLLVLLVLTRFTLEPLLRRLAEKTYLAMAVLAGLPIVLRLLLLLHSPTPVPSGSDDFSYVLLADTVSHLRLANPPHPLHRFFETIFVLQEPTYSSIYPLGQGIALALGHLVFRSYWAGVLLSVGLLCALCYWMLRAWTTPVWALAGGLLAVIQFGPLSSWTNSYWGGAVSAMAGCLVFGSLPRLIANRRVHAAGLLGCGLGLQILTRPFEAGILALAALLFFAPRLRKINPRVVGRTLAVALFALTPALILMIAQNTSVTGNWWTLPYMLSRHQYGVPTSFTFQANPVPHRALTQQQELDYRAQSIIHGNGNDSIGAFMERLWHRARYYRFFCYAPLYLALLMFLARAREWRFLWVPIVLAGFYLGTNFYPYFYPHYIAAASCLCLLVSVKGLEWIGTLRIHGLRVGLQASRLILFVSVTQFVFWYALHLFGTENIWLAFQYEAWDFINFGDAEGRLAINDELRRTPGKQLIFVRYWPQHRFEEWIHNAADIDGSRVVWANDLGQAENVKLREYFHDRRAWLLEPDAQPPRLSAYDSDSFRPLQ